MLNNDILKYILSTTQMCDIVRFSAISKPIRAQVLSLPYKYNVKSSDVFAIAMHKLRNKRFLNPALRKYYINRAIMEHNYVLIREFASVCMISFNELFDVAVGNSPDKLQILRFYRNNWNLTRLIKNEDYVVIQNAYFIVKRRFNRVIYSSKIKLFNARLLCANCTNAEIRAIPIFQSAEMKTALFEYANRELYYEIIDYIMQEYDIIIFDSEIIDDDVKVIDLCKSRHLMQRIPNNAILKYIKNTQKHTPKIIQKITFWIPEYAIYMLEIYGVENIIEALGIEGASKLLFANFELDAMHELSEIDASYVDKYNKLRKQMKLTCMISP
jgi:hypothetical protein